MKEGGFIFSGRTFGWTLRAMMQVYRATGDERYLDAARRYVKRADDMRNKGEVKYLKRTPPSPNSIDKDNEKPWEHAPGLHGLSAY